MTNQNFRRILTTIRVPLLALALLAVVLAALVALGVPHAPPASAQGLTETEMHSISDRHGLSAYVGRVTLCQSELMAMEADGELDSPDTFTRTVGRNAGNQRTETDTLTWTRGSCKFVLAEHYLFSATDNAFISDGSTLTITRERPSPTVDLPPLLHFGVCHRTREVQEAILAKIRETRAGGGCGDITVRDLENIRELTVHGYSRSSIQERDFADLGRLTHLNIHKSPTLTTIPARAFRGASGVIHLDLRGNAIHTLDKDAFGYHPRIRSLNLGYNQIDYLPTGVFRHLSTLERLKLHSNYLVAIEDYQFKFLDSLTHLNLADNKISEIDTDAYYNIFLTLEELDLGGNRLAPVDLNDFRNLTRLTLLGLSNNGITSLPGDTFAGLAALQTLYLNDNELSSLPANIFDDMAQVTSLNLQNNRLTSLPANIFAQNTLLSNLDLSGNQLSSLDASVFSGLRVLQFLFLNDNELTSLPSGLFSDTGVLFNLRLHNNSLTSLHQDIFDGLGKLDVITLQNNSLTALHVDLFNDNVLGSLDLRDNQITSSGLPATLFDSVDPVEMVTFMWELRLGGNNLTSIPSGLFAGLSSMQFLDLSRNGLTALDLNELDPFADTLTFLDLSGNSFTTAPTNAALEAKLTAIEEYYVTEARPTGIVDSITISGGSVEFSTPDRNSNSVIRYSATAPFGADSLTINVGPRDSGAAIGPHDDAVDAFRIGLSDDDGYVLNDRDPNTAGIQIGAPLSRRNVVEFRVDNNHFIIDVYRDAPSRNARLADLSLSGVSLTPAFDSHTFDYTGFADVGAVTTRVNATPEDRKATVGIKNNSVEDADGTVTIDTSSADQVITVEATAEDGVTARTYRVEMARKVTLSASESVMEGDTGVLQVQLNKASRHDTTVSLRTTNTRRATLSHAAVTIPANALSAPAVTITTLDNEDLNDYELRTIGTVTNNDEVQGPDEIFVTILDDDLRRPDAPRNFSAVGFGGETTFRWQIINVPPLKPGEILPFGATELKGVKRIRYDFFVRPPGGTDDGWIFVAHTGSLERRDSTDPFAKTPDRPPLTVRSLPTHGRYEFAMRAVGITHAGHPLLSELSRPYSEGGPGPYNPNGANGGDASGPGNSGPVIIDDTNDNGQSAPSTPRSLSATPWPDRIELTWYPAFRATGYNVQRRLQSGAEYADLGTSTTNAYTDSTALSDVGYAYRVQAVNDHGDSAFSDDALAKIEPPPPAPTGLQAAVGEGSVTLTWTATDDDTFVGYLVTREPRDDNPATLPQVVGKGDADTTSVTDDYVVDGAAYTYSVYAIGATSWSDPATVDVDLLGGNDGTAAPRALATPTGLTASVAEGTVTLAWDAVEGATGYHVLRQGPDETEHAQVGAPTANSYSDTDVTAGSSYSYKVRAVDDDGTGSLADAVEVAVPEEEDPAEDTATGPITGFTLVDASDQSVLATLTAGSSVALADPDGGSYGIRADVDSSATIGSVSLALSGAKTVSRTENVAPYSLYGDGGANALSGEALPAGSYTLTATAYSGSSQGGDELGTLAVSFTVTEPNSAPEFGSSTYSFSIAEDAATGATVGTVSATDADSDGITYTIESGNGDGKFAIDGSTGSITTAGALDYETTPSYTLTVQADDGNGGTDTATVNVTVTDVDESSPGPLTGFTLVDASNQSVLATLTAGTSVELADPSGGSYAVRADVDSGATIGSVGLALSGAKTVSRTENVAPYSLYGDGGANALGGESLPAGSYTLTATAYSGSSQGGDELGTLEVSFTVAQANRSPEFGSSTYNFSIAEDAATSAAVGTVSATDADSDGLTYTIESGNGDGKFAIDGSTGSITTAGALDHETTPSYALTVQADDGSGGTDIATVNVTVTDVDESTPGPLTGFTLVDASNQSVLATLTAGSSVALADPSGGSYAVRADVDANATIGSVRLALSGAKTVSRTENIAPYSLYGDGGANALDGQALPAGSYTLTATAYANKNLGGDVLGTLELSFTITESN